MLSRVMPGSGPVSSRSSPRMRLSSVDLPALGRPSTAMRSGFVGVEFAAVLLLAENQRLGLVLLVRIEAGRGRQRLDERVVEFAEALAMLGGKGDRIAEAEAEGVIGAVAPRQRPRPCWR